MTSTSVPAGRRSPAIASWLHLPLVRLIPLMAVLAAGAVLQLRGTMGLQDTNVWFHLRAGLWILQTHQLPHSALFTQQPDSPWANPSWGFDLLTAVAYRLVGLAAIPLILMLFRFAFAVLTFLLAGGYRDSFWAALVLSAAAQYSIGQPAPRPLLCSMLFFALELVILLEALRASRPRMLYWLPPLFLLWANFDCGFVAGLLLLAACLAALAAARLLPGQNSANSSALLPGLLIAALSALATLANPYTYHQFANFFAERYSRSAFLFLPEMGALSFRHSRDYLLTLFVLSAFFVLGRRFARNPNLRDLFLLLVLVVTMPVIFRIQRDSWLAVIPATAALALMFERPVDERAGSERAPTIPRAGILIAASLGAMALVLIAFLRVPAPDRLQLRVARKFPVAACEFVRRTRPPQPLFNMPDWGGFLSFELPDYPAALDNRASLYGDIPYIQFQQLAHGSVKLDDVPSFANARTLLLERDTDLARALTELPALTAHYRVLYRDDLAVVLQAQ